MAAFGASPDEIERWTAPSEETPEEDHFFVLPENWPVLELFLMVSTQWRATNGQRHGLDYTAVEAATRMAGIAMDEKLFGQLRIMEDAALMAWSETDHTTKNPRR